MLKQRAHLAMMAILLFTALPVSAATTTKVYTNLNLKFSLRYDSIFKANLASCVIPYGENFSIASATENNKLRKQGSSYYQEVDKLFGKDCNMGPGKIAVYKVLAAKGWPAFVSNYQKTLIPNTRYQTSSIQAYSLNGYRASIITTHGKYTQSVGWYTTHEILVTHDSKNVYLVSDNWFYSHQQFATNPYNAKFRAFAQSFRILK